MLITCPECAHSVSDKALACPNCGCPMRSTLDREKRDTGQNKRPRRHRKLPNGFGTVRRLSGNRRRPYAAYPPAQEFTPTGSPAAVPALGYFESYNEAYAALLDFSRSGLTVAARFTSFAEMYERFMQEYAAKKPSKSAVAAYSSAYKRCAALHERTFAELRKPDFQPIFDGAAGMSKSTVANLKKLLNQMYKVAIENDVVDRNYSANVAAGGVECEKGVPFTDAEIEKLWNVASDDVCKVAITMIYTGYRVGELGSLDVGKDRLIGGKKTRAGRERVVPLHPAIRDFHLARILPGLDPAGYRDEFHALLDGLGFPNAATGERHTPHDCRHTFSWLADRYKMDSTAKHMIMGHSLGGDVEVSVYGHRTFEELEAEIGKIIAPH